MLRRVAGLIAVIGLLSWGALAWEVAAEPGDGDGVAFTFRDPQINESSGLVAAGDRVVTVNDSGDSNRIFTVDAGSGSTLGTTSWQGTATDIEALAPADDNSVWVGDLGDNHRNRPSVQVAKVPFGVGYRTVAAPVYELVYPDGPHDAETLLADPSTGRLYVVVKEVRGRVYAAPSRLTTDRPNQLTEIGEAFGSSSDGAFLPDGRHVILRNYGQAAVYTWPALERLATFALPHQRQGEGIAAAGATEVLLSSEGAGTDVLRVVLPDDLQTQMAESAPSGRPDEVGSSVDEPDRVDEPTRGLWPWAVGGLAGIVVLGVLIRALRPR